ncbi:hypothetical protein V6N11_068110 [Hibiscus sabdariffa]|uniref:Uncharacterized protein n=1 Tax=Hibiscus sabdariffa TaxID=183260 RepID=A0ABR2SSP8_9ROSI
MSTLELTKSQKHLRMREVEPYHAPLVKMKISLPYIIPIDVNGMVLPSALTIIIVDYVLIVVPTSSPTFTPCNLLQLRQEPHNLASKGPTFEPSPKTRVRAKLW